MTYQIILNKEIVMESLEKLFSLIQIPLTEEYISSSLTSAIVVGIIACALIIFTSIASKKALGLGITAGIFAIIGSIANHFSVVYFHTTTFVVTEKFVGSSQTEVDQMASDFVENYMTENLPKMIFYVLASAVVFVAWIVTLIFIIKMLKVKPKVFGIFALILHIVKFLFIAPVNTFTPILTNVAATEAAQKSQDTLVYAMVLIPLVLVAIAGLIAMIKRAKTPVAVAEAAAPVAEAEAPAVEEAPAAEAEAEAPAAADEESK